MSTLTKIRTDQSFHLFFTLVKNLSQSLNVEEPVLPRKRKVPRHFDDGRANNSFFSEAVEDWYRVAYFEALDLVIEAIKDRFDQPGYAIYRNLEELLVKGASGEEFDDQKKLVCELYHEIDGTQLNVQLESLAAYFKSANIPVSLKECIKYLQSLSPDAKSFYSEVCTLTRLILVMPATNAISERSFSVMRRVKSYLRSTMRQERLNHVMVLNIYKEELDKLDLIAVANEFVRESEHRKKFLGTFT